MTAKDNFINICNLTTSVLGLRKGSLSYKSRKQKLQVGRSVASIIARIEEKTHRTIIAEILNRDRTLIYHYEKMHQGNYASWSKYREAFNKVYMAYRQLENAKKVFIDKYYMKEYLLKNGVKENDKAEVMIAIKSEDVTAVIQTSYMDFSNQLENIKFALKEYKYEMQIV